MPQVSDVIPSSFDLMLGPRVSICIPVDEGICSRPRSAGLGCSTGVALAFGSMLKVRVGGNLLWPARVVFEVTPSALQENMWSAMDSSGAVETAPLFVGARRARDLTSNFDQSQVGLESRLHLKP